MKSVDREYEVKVRWCIPVWHVHTMINAWTKYDDPRLYSNGETNLIPKNWHSSHCCQKSNTYVWPSAKVAGENHEINAGMNYVLRKGNQFLLHNMHFCHKSGNKSWGKDAIVITTYRTYVYLWSFMTKNG